MLCSIKGSSHILPKPQSTFIGWIGHKTASQYHTIYVDEVNALLLPEKQDLRYVGGDWVILQTSVKRHQIEKETKNQPITT